MNRHAEIVSASLRSIPKEVSEKRHTVAPMADQHLLTQKNEGVPTKRHAELVSASLRSIPKEVSEKLHVELVSASLNFLNIMVPTMCHAELVSASLNSKKRRRSHKASC